MDRHQHTKKQISKPKLIGVPNQMVLISTVPDHRVNPTKVQKWPEVTLHICIEVHMASELAQLC